MADRVLDGVLGHIRRLVGSSPDQSDCDLLQRFIRSEDEGAFATIVRRHGPMVLGVCRRVLGDPHHAEDACQAAFLVLARKAAGVRKGDSLGSFLHGVAYRVACRLRRDLARRRGREVPIEEVAQAQGTDFGWREWRAALDAELARLPDRLRAPLLLCYLEGKTRDEAASELGWSVGTLRGRLARGRELLRGRLARRGLGLSAALFAAALGREAVAALPPLLEIELIKVGAQAPGLVPVHVAALATGVLKTMAPSKNKIGAVVVLAVGALALGTVWAGGQRQGQPGQPAAGGPGVIGPGAADKPDRPEPAADTQRAQAEIRMKLKQLALAMHNYADVTGALPPPAIYAPGKEPSGGGAGGPGMGPGAGGPPVPGGGAPGVRPPMGGGRPGGIPGGTPPGNSGPAGPAGGGSGFPGGGGDQPAGLPLGPGAPPRPAALPGFPGAPGGGTPGENSLAGGRPETPPVPGPGPGAPARGLPLAGFPGINPGPMTGTGLEIGKVIGPGQPALLSWRVALLPYLGEQKLYQQFHLDEPWDGPHNRKLIKKIPKVYAAPSGITAEAGTTCYQVFVGPQAGFEKHHALAFSAFTDGTSNTILIVEGGSFVPWTKPEDLHYEADEPLPRLGGLFPGMFQAAFADGSVHTLSTDARPELLRALITRDGGEVADTDKAHVPTSPRAAALRRANEQLRAELARARAELEQLRREKEVLDEEDAETAVLRKERAELEETVRHLRLETERLRREVQKLKEGRSKPGTRGDKP